jgi:uncharacterized protein (DUF302 family)
MNDHCGNNIMRNALYLISSLLCLMSLSTHSFAESGLIHHTSEYTAKETSHRLVSLLEKKGMTIFSRIDHQAGAKSVDTSLRFTEVIIFGNPKIGAPLMQCAQSSGIDLPQKALIWEDAQGTVHLSYNDPQYLVTRHTITACDAIIKKMSAALDAFARAATNPQP